jgi:hypothetical protein
MNMDTFGQHNLETIDEDSKYQNKDMNSQSMHIME